MRALASAAIIVFTLGVAAAGASVEAKEGPWCGQQLDQGAGSPRCDFPTLEACRQEMVAGARGICNINPRWEGGSAASPRKRTRRH